MPVSLCARVLFNLAAYLPVSLISVPKRNTACEGKGQGGRGGAKPTLKGHYDNVYLCGESYKTLLDE